MTNKTVEATLAERHGQYGPYVTVSAISQSLKKVVHESPNYKFMPPPMKESLDMICNKMARILTGNYYLHDTWHDVSGYAKLISNEIERMNKNDEANGSDREGNNSKTLD